MAFAEIPEQEAIIREIRQTLEANRMTNDDDDCDSGNGIQLTSGGTFTLTVRVHDVNGSIPALSSALLSEGEQELKVIDTQGAEGTLFVTIAERTLEITPAAARPRSNRPMRIRSSPVSR